MKKHLLLVPLLIVVSSAASAQFYKSLLPSPQFTKALEMVVLDFRYDYRNIQGNRVDSLGEVQTFESGVKLPGSADCKILRFHSAVDTTACWQSIIYSGENYKEAVRAYENTVRLVKKSNMRWVDQSVMNFTGELIKANEDLRFTTSVLDLKVNDHRYEDFRAEVELIATHVDRWQVQLNLSKKIDQMPASK